VAQLHVSWVMIMIMMNYILPYTVQTFSEGFPNTVMFFVFCSIDGGRAILAAGFSMHS
jgi:hypothetical protein